MKYHPTIDMNALATKCVKVPTIHGQWNRSSKLINCQSNACCMVQNNWLLGQGLPLLAGLEQTMEFMCKTNRATLHYVLASFVLFHSVKTQKRLYCR